jgi:hypothetical protein
MKGAPMSDTMSWYWIVVASLLPVALAVAVAWPFWGRSRDSLGSGIGACVIFVFAIAFVGREYVHLQNVTEQCIAAETNCRVYPEPFTRVCIYGLIALAQVGALFAVGGAIEHRMSNRDFAKEWRR